MGNGTAPPQLPIADVLGPAEQQLNAPTVADLAQAPSLLAQPVAQNDAALAGEARRRSLRTLLRRIGLTLLVIGVLAGGAYAFLQRGDVSKLQSGNFSRVQVPLNKFTSKPALSGNLSQILTVNGQLNVNNSIVLTPGSQPVDPVTGQIYYDKTSNQIAYYNGTDFVTLVGTTSGDILQNTTNIQNITNTTNNTGSVNANNGSLNTIAKFTGTNTLGDSIIVDNGTSINVAGNINITGTASFGAEKSIWPTSTTPTNPTDVDNQSVELGVKFRTDSPGVVRGIRFYKGTNNTGTHIGSLWSSTGALMAQATFTNETATGWQTVRFATPVTVLPDTTYVASYHAPVGGYATDSLYFFGTGADNTPLHALQSGTDGGNGVFKYNASPTLPTQTFNATNYWVDIIYAESPPAGSYQINGAQITSADLANNSELAKRSSSQVFTGKNVFRPNNDDVNAFIIQSTTGNNIFTGDTANGRIYIGSSTNTNGVVLVLGTRDVAGDPSGVEGGMYYNSFQQMFRCYRDGVWADCATQQVSHAYESYDEFLGGATTSFTNNDNIGELGWHAYAIGANGTLNFNPSTPTPSADRPGVLWLQTPAVTNQGTTLGLSNASGGSMLLRGYTLMKAAVAIGATSNMVLRFGLTPETTATTQPISGVWWEANPAVSSEWQYCYGNGTTATCAPSLVDLTANTWARLEIRVHDANPGSGNVEFLVNGNSTIVSGLTLDTTTRISPAYTCYTTTGTAQNCYWDYFQLRGTTSAVR